ncbi:MAG: HAMP domain-containing protein, partial [Acidobacteria bacterium]|nr:HAMP domain-containing protein [Acidobacteriota bacterium]
MRITTKIILGFGILIALMIALVVFQVLRINRMQSIIRGLSEVNFEVSSRAVRLSGIFMQVADFAKKVVGSTAPEYELAYIEWRDQAQQEIRDLARTANSEKELEQIGRLVESWDEFLRYFETYRASMPPGPRSDPPPEMVERLDRLRIHADSVYRASSDVIQREAERSMTTADQAKILSGAAASIALVLSLFVSFFVVQSISAPLKQLTRGTRAIAEGKFFYRLDTSHRDEFSQLAKDFNTMTERLNDLDRMKRDFVAHVSHELKSPLASMQETVQALLDLVPGELTEKQQRLLELNL